MPSSISKATRAGTLSVTSTEDAILSTGNINIDGAGSVNATSTGFDAINAGGDLAIKGSGNVNATGASDGIRANGNITIDDSGAVTARATKDKGIGADKNLTIKGGGTVEASSADGEALWSGGNINISDGSQVKASSEKDAAVEAKGSLAATNASLNVNGFEYGVYAHKGITLDHANVTVRASKGRYGGANALFTYQDDIVVKNGSTVDAFAEGEVSAAFSTRNDRPNEKGGHIYISDSVVKAIARYVENGDGPIPYSENQDGETRREPQGENIGIIAQTSEGVTPAVISIIRSKVTAEGDTAAIFARAMSADGKTIGTIKIENAAIQTPEGGKVIDYRKLRDGIYEAGQATGTATPRSTPSISKRRQSTTIAPPEVAKRKNPSPTRPSPQKASPRSPSRTPSLRAQSRPRPLRLQPRKPRLPACSRQPATPRVRPSWQPSLREQPLSPQAPWRAVSVLRRLCAHGSSREGPEPQHRLTTPPPSSPPAVAFSICVRRGCTRLSLV